MECVICCCRTTDGVACPTCGQRCCIKCETQNKNCPFCRQASIPWMERIQKITSEQFYTYLREYKLKDILELDKFNQARKLFLDIVHDVPYAYDYFDELEDDDMLHNLMLITRDYIYSTAMYTKNLDDIDFLLEFIEDVHDHLENPEVCIDLNMDEVEDLLFEFPDYNKKPPAYTPTKTCREKIPKIHTGFVRRRYHYHILTD